jgi:hypothetical protein
MRRYAPAKRSWIRLCRLRRIAEPVPATLRTAMHGWVGYLDEMMIDRITHGDVDGEALVDLAVSALVATLRSATEIDPSITYTSDVSAALDG